MLGTSDSTGEIRSSLKSCWRRNTHTNAPTCLLAAHWFTLYVASSVLSFENAERAARVKAIVLKGVLQTSSWPVTSVASSFSSRQPCGCWYIRPRRRLQSFSLELMHPVLSGSPGRPFPPNSNHLTSVRWMWWAKTLGMLWVFHQVFVLWGILSDRGKDVA